MVALRHAACALLKTKASAHQCLNEAITIMQRVRNTSPLEWIIEMILKQTLKQTREVPA
jgi:hypothetical protein